MPFEAFDESLEIVRRLREILARLGRRNPDLCRQIRRASSSVSLNLAEGAGRSGRDRLHHYRIAAGSAREVHAALQVAEAWGDLEGEAAEPLFAKLDRLHGLLWGLTH